MLSLLETLILMLLRATLETVGLVGDLEALEVRVEDRLLLVLPEVRGAQEAQELLETQEQGKHLVIQEVLATLEALHRLLGQERMEVLETQETPELQALLERREILEVLETQAIQPSLEQ